ncbi:sulfotransferase family protein [Nonomuraea longicatena]|uniref:Sulfotransferase family protein n=1 Tax=Nonomuraea longicatena TaxID=83682 RepID=A0ABP3ZQ26_9ACTN
MLEVIGAGFGRTGTLSMKAALERLGFGPCYHAVEVMRHPEHVPLWDAAAAGAPDWETVFDGYRSTVDFPSTLYWKELIAAYPEAKVILTLRDPQAWYASVRSTVVAEAEAKVADGDPPPDWLLAVVERVREEKAAIAWFEEHNAEVRSTVPADRLLVFEVTQGWGPLCAFLGVEAPAEPFPRLNEREKFRELLDGIDAERRS